MRPLMIALVTTLISLSSAFAAGNFPPSFDATSWKTLMNKTIKEGAQLESNFGLYIYLSRVTPPDTSQPRAADYFTLRGAYSNNRYVPFEVSSVTEDWNFDAHGNWTIDQVIRRLNVEGELLGISRTRIVETKEGTILSMTTLPAGDANSEVELKSWGEKLSSWTN